MFNYVNELGFRGALGVVRSRSSSDREIGVWAKRVGRFAYFRKGTNDFGELRRILGRVDNCFKLGPEPRLIIDAGANVGYTSMIYASRYSSASVVAIEPHPDNIRMLRKNCAGLDNVKILEGAMWLRNARLTII